MLLTLIAARSCQRNVYSCDELILLLFVQCLPPLLSSLLYFCTCPVPGTREIFVEQMNEEMSEGRKSSCIFLDHQNPIFPLLVCDPQRNLGNIWNAYPVLFLGNSPRNFPVTSRLTGLLCLRGILVCWAGNFFCH